MTNSSLGPRGPFTSSSGLFEQFTVLFQEQAVAGVHINYDAWKTEMGEKLWVSEFELNINGGH